VLNSESASYKSEERRRIRIEEVKSMDKWTRSIDLGAWWGRKREEKSLRVKVDYLKRIVVKQNS
jgi:hypothetical protein